MAREITVCEALKELKTLDARINKTTKDALFITVSVGGKLPVGQKSETDFETKAKGSLQSIRDLIAQRNEIKASIVASNAVTNVTVGNIQYTVAGVIERKKSIEYEKELVKAFGLQLLKALREIENTNARASQVLDGHISTILGKDAKEKGGKEVDDFTAQFMARNEAKVVDPINVKEELDKLDASVREFEANVDTALSISNATTKITVK
jgi:hypothetical protein